MGISLLMISTICAVVGHIFVKKTDGMTKIRYILSALVSFMAAITLLSIAIKYMNMGIAFAIWSGLSIVFNNLFNIIVYKEEFSFRKLRGLLFIIAGVVILEAF
ncbi:MAG: DMT family transporter [Bacillota bacterium]|uniref:EamA family transporter n=1 Tax=Virgibacillus salarius TaxID=447199 RepID=A0A941IA23_9BACI|nr:MULTISPECIES: SMR family transporter [Bacillaceae]NAZ08896.1 EamA family transporter [Agaribacter marinus]MBR7796188.1 EamA family transporter [Virgibacillus salarius]MCC2249701.1 EamA family transporter [Virgibacillus sp. AGTR]MDY7042692.1 SMR family transporter [Virgibacillus sp. M23]QRZ17146.1 EamA family transporter [Virgibacillus sp. AGTR]